MPEVAATKMRMNIMYDACFDPELLNVEDVPPLRMATASSPFESAQARRTLKKAT